MKHFTALLALLLTTACGGDSITGTETGTETESGNGPGGSPTPPPLVTTDDTTDTGDAETGSGVCDEDAFNDCVQTLGAALDLIDNCTGVFTGCEWSQCYGTYLKTWHVKTAEIRTTCLDPYPACVEHANIPFYYCIADCYEIQETCDDGDICESCTAAGAECFNACYE